MAITATNLELMSDKVVLAAQPYVTWLQNFCTDLSVEDSSPYAGVGVHVLKATAADWNDTSANYFTGSGSDNLITVPLDGHKIAGFGLTDLASTKGDYTASINKYGPVAGRAIGKAISDAAIAKINAATALTSFDMNTDGKDISDLTLADFTALVGKMKKFTVDSDEISYDPAECALCLSAAAYAKLISLLPANIVGDGKTLASGVVGQFLGLKDVVCGNFSQTYDSTGVFVGFIVPMGAVAVAARAIGTGEVGNTLLAASTFADESTGLPFSQRVVRDESVGKTVWNVEALYGVEMTYDASTCPNAPRIIACGIGAA